MVDEDEVVVDVDGGAGERGNEEGVLGVSGVGDIIAPVDVDVDVLYCGTYPVAGPNDDG